VNGTGARAFASAWAVEIGCKPEHLLRKGTHVAGRPGATGALAHALRCGDACVIAVHPRDEFAVRHQLGRLPAESSFNIARITNAIGHLKIGMVSGPTFVGLHQGIAPDPHDGGSCRAARDDDAESIAQLQSAVGEIEWRQSGINLKSVDRDGVFVCESAGRIAAIATCRDWAGDIATVCAATSPDYRRAGHGRAVAAHATAYALSRSRVPQCNVLESNAAAVALATSLGFDRIATHYGVVLRPEFYPFEDDLAN
jgi:ribosomal protein S18 acetylase RimI-like enzyme